MKSKLHLFLYSLILPTLWLGTGFAIHSISPETQFGIPGLVVILLSTCWLIAFLFVKNFGRQLKVSEEIQLIFCCWFWAVAIEALTLFSLAPEGEFNQEKFINTLVIAAVIQLVYNFLATHFACKRFISKRLGKIIENGT